MLAQFVRMENAGSGQSGGDDGHLVELVGVAAAGEVVDGGVQALQDGAVSGEAAQTLGDLIADVAGLDLREDEGVGVTGDLGAGELLLTDHGGDGGVELHLAVDGQLRSGGLGLLAGVLHLVHSLALAGALGGVAQESDLGVDAEGSGGLGALQGGLDQCILVGIDLDGAVARPRRSSRAAE